ncbi:MAG: cytidylyltransferase domain-containing protein [Opitutales bacterium]
MRVVGSIIARLGSKRLIHKNLMPFHGMPMVGWGIRVLEGAKSLDEIVVSTESELIARVAHGFGARVLRRPEALSADNVPSIPVFQHIMNEVPGDVHVNFNINFPFCESVVVDDAVAKVQDLGEVLSVPFAVWAQTQACLDAYGDPWKITAHQYDDDRVGDLDVHTLDDLLDAYRHKQGELPGWSDM